jgi:hypothetical protein
MTSLERSSGIGWDPRTVQMIINSVLALVQYLNLKWLRMLIMSNLKTIPAHNNRERNTIMTNCTAMLNWTRKATGR